MIHCPNCNKPHSIVHPKVNRCSCGLGFDGEGNQIDANIPHLVVKVHEPLDIEKESEGFHNKPGSALESLIPDQVGRSSSKLDANAKTTEIRWIDGVQVAVRLVRT